MCICICVRVCMRVYVCVLTLLEVSGVRAYIRMAISVVLVCVYVF